MIIYMTRELKDEFVDLGRYAVPGQSITKH
jgi:hypothetical protein